MAPFRDLLRATRPLVFAHRGGAALAPENTLAAFDRAVALGVHGLELDVRLSRDGVPVVIHDPTLDRTTDASGPVGRLTADELARVDAGARMRIDGKVPFRGRGLGIPRLADVLRRYPDQALIIELKERATGLAQAVVDEIRAARAVERVCLGSFGMRVLNEVRRRAPELVTSAARWEIRWALYRSWIGISIRDVPYGVFQVPERAGSTRVVSPRFLAYARGIGRPVQVWTINEEATMRRLLSWGVNALITDRPDVALALLRSSEPAHAGRRG